MNNTLEIAGLSEESLAVNRIYMKTFNTLPKHIKMLTIKNADIEKFSSDLDSLIKEITNNVSDSRYFIKTYSVDYQAMIIGDNDNPNSDAFEGYDTPYPGNYETTSNSHKANKTIIYTISNYNVNLLFRFWTDKGSEFSLRYYYNDESEEVLELIEKFNKLIPSIPKIKEKNKFNIICHEGNRFYTKEFDLKSDPELNGVDFYDFYNEDFQEFSEHIIDRLRNDSKGLVLLHGDAGTGKTSFLKYLIKTLGKKNIIYLPPDMTKFLSSPEFFSFLLENPKSILLIEDAENVLRHREAGGDQSVSNILNISDGILGNALQYQIICTFNSDLNCIDEALRRPGRLLGEYRFEKLTKDRTNRLISKLNPNVDISLTNNELTLAEIFAHNQKLFKSEDKKVKLGFM